MGKRRYRDSGKQGVGVKVDVLILILHRKKVFMVLKCICRIKPNVTISHLEAGDSITSNILQVKFLRAEGT